MTSPLNPAVVRIPKPETEAEKSEENKEIKSVVAGKVIRRKKPLSKRFVETFIGGDARSVTRYVLMEVLVPALKDVVTDVVSQATERMIFGESRSSGRRSGSRPASATGFVQYNRFAQSGPHRPDPRLSRK